MRMHFGFSYKEIILFQSWKTNSVGEFIGSWIAVLLFSIFFEFFKSFRAILEIRWNNNKNNHHRNNINTNDMGDEEKEKDYISSSFLDGYYPQFTKKDIIRGLLHGLEMAMSLVLMLIIMGFNIALFFSIIIGVILGHILFGRFRQYKPKSTC